VNRFVKIVLVALLAAVIAGGSFYGGMVYGQGQQQATSAVAGGAAGAQDLAGPGGMQPGGQMGAGSGQGGMLAGEILSIEGGALTLEDQSGSEIQVHVTDTTLIQKQAEVSVNDLQEGETVLVSGSQEADGSITARMVQVSSADGLGMPGGFPPGGQSGSAPANP
jgi:hypothetical protein